MFYFFYFSFLLFKICLHISIEYGLKEIFFLQIKLVIFHFYYFGGVFLSALTIWGSPELTYVKKHVCQLLKLRYASTHMLHTKKEINLQLWSLQIYLSYSEKRYF